MLPEWLDMRTIYLIGHIFGVALGAGGAFASDGMFFLSVRDGKLTRTKLDFMQLGSRLVWAGLAILVVSGIGLFLQAPEAYLASSKFLAKMTIVGIIAANGLIFHFVHFPILERHVDVHFPTSPEFLANSKFLMLSGALSASSWSATIILGALRGVPYTYGQVMLVYCFVIGIAVTIGLLGRKRILGLN